VHDVLHSIYRPFQKKPVGAMRLTFSLDLPPVRLQRIALPT
jgi:hypothetical protein